MSAETDWTFSCVQFFEGFPVSLYSSQGRNIVSHALLTGAFWINNLFCILSNWI